MANRRRCLSLPVLIAVFFCLVACGDSGGPSGPDPNDSVASVTVAPPQVAVDVASSTQLSAAVRNGRGETMTTQVSWSSSSTAVATVDATGLVTGVTEGASTITASAGGHSGTSAVTVNDPFPPLQPSNVVASPVSNTEIRVTWTDNSNNEDDFRIDRELVAGGADSSTEAPARAFAEVAIVGANATSFSDTGLHAGTTYRYWVRACNENGCSDSAAGAGDVSTYLVLAIATSALPQGTTGVAYSKTLEASGGDGSYTWSLSQGVLPEGLMLVPESGVLGGTPTEGGAFPMSVQVQSGDGQTAAKALSVEVIFVFSCSGQAEIPETECNALEAFYNTTNGPGWTNSTDWFATFSPCNWYGVTCSEGSVTELVFLENGLTGPIPPELADLTNLTRLYFRRNALSGEIPIELASLANLQRLDLHTNQLTGSIPPQLGSLANLERLTLQGNDLTGAIPAELGNLSNLTELSLGSNDLTGEIPSEFGNLSNLIELRINVNQVSGPLPPELGGLGALEVMYLESNHLSGAIPPELGNMSNLGNLSLSGNELTGSIPVELANLSNLTFLSLPSNQLTGTIPSQLGNLAKLRYLNLYDNQLTGGIPTEIGNITTLERLYLYSNQLSGAVPLAVAQLGGMIQSTYGLSNCDFLPGNAGLNVPNAQEYRDADLDADGFICEVPVPGPSPMLSVGHSPAIRQGEWAPYIAGSGRKKDRQVPRKMR